MNLYVYRTAFLRAEYDERLILWKMQLASLPVERQCRCDNRRGVGFQVKLLWKMQQSQLR